MWLQSIGDHFYLGVSIISCVFASTNPVWLRPANACDFIFANTTEPIIGKLNLKVHDCFLDLLTKAFLRLQCRSSLFALHVTIPGENHGDGEDGALKISFPSAHLIRYMSSLSPSALSWDPRAITNKGRNCFMIDTTRLNLLYSPHFSFSLVWYCVTP